MSNVLLPRRVVSQPIPFIVPGGDCGACVLGGLLGLSVADVYTRYAQDGKPASFGHVELHNALLQAHYQDGLIDRVVAAVPIWPYALPKWDVPWGLPAWSQALQWFDYVRMALDGGYYALAGVTFEQGGPFAGIDHIVLLCGAREVRIPIDAGGARIEKEVLVSCSSTKSPDEEWVNVGDFLSKRGGYNVLLARPAE